uniref:HTH OST-type domain-containing protein n=1 Tax=Panagrellus redivivus TaxID=6233 RepID=A0A7E4VPA9_PANRE
MLSCSLLITIPTSIMISLVPFQTSKDPNMAKKPKVALVAAANNNDVDVEDLKIWLNSLAGTEPNGISLHLLVRMLKADFGFDLNVIANTNGFSSVFEMLQDEELSSHIYTSGGPNNTMVHAVTNDATEKIAGIISKTKKTKRQSTKKRPTQRRWHNPHFGGGKPKHTSYNGAPHGGGGGYSFGGPKPSQPMSSRQAYDTSSKQAYGTSSKQAYGTSSKTSYPSFPQPFGASSSQSFGSSSRQTFTAPTKQAFTPPKSRPPQMPPNSLSDGWETGFRSASLSTKAGLSSSSAEPSTFMASMSGFSQAPQRSNVGGNTAPAPLSSQSAAPKIVSAPQRRFTMSKPATTDSSHDKSLPSSASTVSRSTVSSGSRFANVDDFNKENISVQPVNSNRDSFNGVNNFDAFKGNVFDSSKPAPTTRPRITAPPKSPPKPPSRGRFTSRIDPTTSKSNEKPFEDPKQAERALNADPRRPQVVMAKGSMYNKSYPSPLLWSKAFADVTNQSAGAESKEAKPQVTAPVVVHTSASTTNVAKPTASTFANVQMAPPTMPRAVDSIFEEALQADLPPGCDFSDDDFEEDSPYTRKSTDSPAASDPVVPSRARLMNVIADYGGELYTDVFLYEFYEMFGREMTTDDFREIYKSDVPTVMAGFLNNFITVCHNDRVILTHPNPYIAGTVNRTENNWNQLYDLLAQNPGRYVPIPEDVAKSFGFQDFRAIFFTGNDHPVWRKVLKFVPNGIMLEPSDTPVPKTVPTRQQ